MLKPRIPLTAGIILGLFAMAYMLFLSPFEIGTDFQAYYFAVRAWFAGESIYNAAPPTHPGHHFLYLPATLLWFAPFGLFPEWWMAYVFMVIVNVAGGILFAKVLINVIEDRGVALSKVDRGLIIGFLFLSTLTIPNLLHGQVNFLLGVAIGVGLIAQISGRSRWSGLLIGLAATLKLFPSVIGLWFLYKRDLQALGMAILTGLFHIALSIGIFGLETTATFFTQILPQRFGTGGDGGLPANLSIVTIRRPLSTLLGLDGVMISLAALAIGGLIVAYVFWHANDALVKLLGLVVVTLIAFPSYFIYLPIVLFPLIPLLYLRQDWLFVVGATFLTATFSLKQVEAVLNLFPVTVAELVLTVVTPIFTVATPPLIGCILLLTWIGQTIRYQDAIAPKKTVN